MTFTAADDRASFSARGVAGLVLAAAAFWWFRSYIFTGFNVADDGHFAQVAYEFLNGAHPSDIRFGYGVAWFKTGELLFRFFGADYAVVQAFYYALITATAILSMLIVAETTGRSWLGLAAGGALIAVPAFPATAFYAFCPLLNVYFQLRIARSLRHPSIFTFAAAAAALSLTFMIRPDFGYILSIPFILLWFSSIATGGGRRAAGGAVWAAAAFALVQAPLAVDGWRNDYLDLAVADVMRYPRLLAEYVAAAFGLAGDRHVDGLPEGAGGLLRRPGLAALRLDHPQAGLALLTYAPAIALTAFAVVWGAAAAFAVASGARGAVEWAAARATLLVGAAAGFPHYFLFRPDLAHIANFMPAFLTAAAVFAADITFSAADGSRRRRRFAPQIVGAAGAAVLCAFAVFYLRYGMVNPGTGSAAASVGRDQRFIAAHGVDTLLARNEIGWLQPLHDVVAAHSQPLDRIVCVPFCPGVAFMTGRRMLFREYYVDDSFLLTDPKWLDRAIALTAAARPPVVVVLDWAVNGSDVSRFGVWAARYVANLLETGYRPSPVPGGVVYVRN